MTVALRTLATALVLFGAHAQLLDDPEVIPWKGQLPAGMEQGNAIVAEDSTLYATTMDGGFHKLRSFNNDIMTFTPTPVVEGAAVVSRSGLVLIQGNSVAVYAISEIPTSPASTERSRVLALNTTTLDVLWEVTLQGEITGTPVAGRGRLFVSHNTGTTGSLSILEETDSLGYVLTDTFPVESPLGPPTLVRQRGREHVFVAESDNDGSLYLLREDQNDTYEWLTASRRFVRPSATAPVANNDGQVFLAQHASAVSGWVDRNNLNDLLQQGNEDDVPPRWTQFMAPNESDADAPIRAQPLLHDESLCVAAAGPQVGCYGILRGRAIWTYNEGIVGEHWTPPLRQENAVYFVESFRSTIRQFDMQSGDLLWQLDCDDVGVSCLANVVADAAVEGNILYVGDTDGIISAIRVASFETTAPTGMPTGSPSAAPTGSPVVTGAPTTPLPTSMPTAVPSEEEVVVVDEGTVEDGEIEKDEPVEDITTDEPPIETEEPNDAEVVDNDTEDDRSVSDGQAFVANDNSDNPNLAIIMGAVGGGLALAILLFYLCARRRKEPEKKLMSEVAASRKWREDRNAYEQACEDAEKELMQEILGSGAATVGTTDGSTKNVKQLMDEPVDTDSPRRRRRSHSSSPSKPTPQTLASIEESEGDFEDDNEQNDVEQGLYSAPAKEDELEVVAKSLSTKFLETKAEASKKKAALQEDITKVVTQQYEFESQSVASQQKPSSSDANSHAPFEPDHVAEGGEDEEPGRIVAGARVAEAEPAPEEPAHPTSDVMSIDGSLYMDESTVLTMGTREFPDDESSKIAGVAHSVLNDLIPGLGSYMGSSSEPTGRTPSSHQGTPIRRTPADRAPEVTAPLQKTSSEPVPSSTKVTPEEPTRSASTAPRRDIASDRNHLIAASYNGQVLRPSFSGKSVRPSRSRAGFFTRSSKRSVSSDTESKEASIEVGNETSGLTPDGYVEQPERLSYEPTREGGQKQKPPSQKNDTSAWGSFLSELSKAEEAFFNPQLKSRSRTLSPPPPPPSMPSPPDSPSSTSTPPPPPSDDGSSDYSSDGNDAEVIPYRSRRFA